MFAPYLVNILHDGWNKILWQLKFPYSFSSFMSYQLGIKVQALLTHSIIPTLFVDLPDLDRGRQKNLQFDRISIYKRFYVQLLEEIPLVAVTWLGIAFTVQTIRHWIIVKCPYLMVAFLFISVLSYCCSRTWAQPMS